MADRVEYLFWTKVQGRDGELRTVKVFVDIEHCLEIARRAVRNKGRKSKLGPISAEALAGDIDMITGQRR